MKFLNFIHLVISTIFFNYVASGRVESCVEQRVRDNENSLNGWENLHPLFVGDARAQVNMTRRNLQLINQTLFSKISGIERRSSIIIVDLSINRISAIENGTFERLHNLRILLLRVNGLEEITASQFKGLMMLEELDLSLNSIHNIERDALHGMERLRKIDLSGNCLFELRPYIFFRNVRLVNIFFNDNFLDTLPVLMPHSQRLEHLNVTANRFTNLTSLIYYNNIQSLDVSHNPLSLSNSMIDSDSDSSDSSSSSDDNYTMRMKYNSNNIQRRSRSARISEEAQKAHSENGQRKLMKRSPQNERYIQLTQQQMQQLQEQRINRLEYFTCRNCSLSSLDLLVQFPKLKYVDVSSNMIKSVDSTRLAVLEYMEYLDVSDNISLESLSLKSLLANWPHFRALILNNNPALKCDLVARMRNIVEHLNKIFKLDVNKCK